MGIFLIRHWCVGGGEPSPFVGVATPEQAVLGEAAVPYNWETLLEICILRAPQGNWALSIESNRQEGGESQCQSNHPYLQKFGPNQNRMAPSGTCVAPGFITG